MDKFNINMEDTVGISKRIYEICKENEKSQRQFAKKILFKPAYINKIINNRKKPSERVLIAICYEYKVNINWLLHGTGEKYIGDNKDIDIRYAINLINDLNPIFRKLLLKVIKTFVQFEDDSK